MKKQTNTLIKKSSLVFLLTIGVTALLNTVSCASKETLSSGLEVMSESQYLNIIDKYTEETQSYEGLYNQMDVKGTFINTQVAEAQVDQGARMYMWDKQKYESEFIKTKSDLEKETTVFVSFFTPEKKQNDLNKKTSVWKIYLTANGKRYEGKATKISGLLREVNSYYPFHTQFSLPYLIKFPVGTKEIEKQEVKLIMTGPVGSATLNFKPML